MTIQEKTIEQLERISSHLSSIGEKEDYTDIAINALEQTRWIPVSEKNPETTSEYLTTIKWRDDKNGYKYAVVKRDYYADVKTWNDSLVIAWQSLPEPYKESEDKCKSCMNKGCIFQSGIARSRCVFYKAESEEQP